MKLDYATLISPYPLPLDQIGNVKSPTLGDIWNPRTTWQIYNLYLQFLLMTPQIYCGKLNPASAKWYQSLSEEEAARLSMFDLITADSYLQHSYEKLFDFFFVETVRWDDVHKLFVLSDDWNEEPAATGIIDRNHYPMVCDIILQRCGIQSSDTAPDISTVKNKRAREILKKLQKGREMRAKKSSPKGDMELPNLITALAAKSNSINFTNIWELTVYQFYEQFKKEQTNVYFDIQKMSVAAYGNSKNTFKGNEWYHSDN